MKKLLSIMLSVALLFSSSIVYASIEDYEMYFSMVEYEDYDVRYPQILVEYKGENLDGLYSEPHNASFITAVYSSENQLIGVYAEDIVLDSWMESIPLISDEVYENGEYLKCFLWSKDIELMPICESGNVALYHLKVNYRKEVSSEPVTLSVDAGDKEIAEKKIAKYSYGSAAPTPTEFYFKECADYTLDFSDDNSVELKENGCYVVYVKYANGLESYKDICISSITEPEIELSYTVTKNNTALVTVDIAKQNENTAIAKIVWDDDDPVMGGSYLTSLLNTGTAVEGNTFEVTKSGRYAVAVCDEWGNGSYKVITVELSDTSVE